MEKMSNVIIDRAERGKSGEASWGKWQAWSVWFVGMEPKFDYFERDNVVPFPGMQVTLAEYTVEQSGQYTNYKLKKLVPAQLAGLPVPANPPVQGPRLSPVVPAAVDYEKEKRLTMCTSYAKDLMVELLHDGSYGEESFSVIIDLVAKGGKLLAEKLGEKSGVVPEPKVTPQPGDTVGSVNPQTGLPTIPGPPTLTGQKFADEIITPAMTEAATEILVPPVVLPTPKEGTPDDDIPF